MNKKKIIIIIVSILLLIVIVFLVLRLFRIETADPVQKAKSTKIEYKIEDTSNYTNKILVCISNDSDETIYKVVNNKKDCKGKTKEIKTKTKEANIVNVYSSESNFIPLYDEYIKFYDLNKNNLINTFISYEDYTLNNLYEQGKKIYGIVLEKRNQDNIDEEDDEEENDYIETNIENIELSFYSFSNSNLYGHYNFIECIDNKCDYVYLGNKKDNKVIIKLLNPTSDKLYNIDDNATYFEEYSEYSNTYFNYYNGYLSYFNAMDNNHRKAFTNDLKEIDKDYEFISDQDSKIIISKKENILVYDLKGNLKTSVKLGKVLELGVSYAIINDNNQISYITYNDIFNDKKELTKTDIKIKDSDKYDKSYEYVSDNGNEAVGLEIRIIDTSKTEKDKIKLCSNYEEGINYYNVYDYSYKTKKSKLTHDCEETSY